MDIRVKLFGAFRNYSTQESVELQAPEPCTIADIRLLLGKTLMAKHADERIARLLQSSVFANHSEILKDESTVLHDGDIAILPPVCGG